MPGFGKLLVFGIVVGGVAIGFNSCSAMAVKSKFANDVQDVVKSSRGLADNAEQQIEQEIRIRAEKHDITLAEDAVKVHVARMDFRPLGKFGNKVLNRTVRATVTYQRKILPFYKKRYTITKTGKVTSL